MFGVRWGNCVKETTEYVEDGCFIDYKDTFLIEWESESCTFIQQLQRLTLKLVCTGFSIFMGLTDQWFDKLEK